MKIYLIYSPEGKLYRPSKRGNCTYLRRHAAEAKCPKGYEVREFDLIEPKELASLQDDSFKLSCLENAGVDNWSGYDFAMEVYRDGCDS